MSARERDPARLAAAVIGGGAAGTAAAICGLLLVLIAYVLIIGQGSSGLEGLSRAAMSLSDPHDASAVMAVLRLTAGTASDGVFMLVFVAFAAYLVTQPLIAYVTIAHHVRWRLLGVGMALAVAAMGPIILAEWLMTAGGAAAPVVAISPQIGDRVAYALSCLLFIPAAAAEEYFFRGWLLRQLGAFLRRPLMLVAVTALTFSAAHFDFSPDVFLARALMGAGFAYMTLRLGGIEFSTGVHAVNNMLIALFIAPLTLNPAAGSAGISASGLVGDLALVGGYVLITEMTARLAPLRALAGVRPEELSPSDTAPAAV